MDLINKLADIHHPKGIKELINTKQDEYTICVFDKEKVDRLLEEMKEEDDKKRRKLYDIFGNK